MELPYTALSHHKEKSFFVPPHVPFTRPLLMPCCGRLEVISKSPQNRLH